MNQKMFMITRQLCIYIFYNKSKNKEETIYTHSKKYLKNDRHTVIPNYILWLVILNKFFINSGF